MPASAAMYPSLIVANARIATGDPARPWATAIAISGETLAAIGAAAEILKMAQPETRIVDAKGAVISLPAGARVGTAVRVSTTGDSVEVSLTVEA